MRKLRYLIGLSVVLWASNCSFSQQTTTVKAVLDPKVRGWYFIQMTVDSNSQYRTTTLRFQDTMRVVRVFVKDVDNTVVSPFDAAGNDLSDRLQYILSRQVSLNTYIFRFYNPTEEELRSIVSWDPTDDRAEAIYQKGEKEFNSYFTNKLKKIDQ